tara:strand:+ start:986 stop:1270 length:285 start_codon:yes stop_codon:yes gene_type:complete
MIKTVYGRYVPTLEVYSVDGRTAVNIFKSEIYKEENHELTDAINKSQEYLSNHFGFVLLYHNERLLKRMCNYKLFDETFRKMNLYIKLMNHIGG